MIAETGLKSRIEYFDFLRIFATLAVIVIHVTTPYWYTGNIKSIYWHIINFFNNTACWSVPIFFMMSGTLFIGSDRTIQQILSKNILRLVTAFLFWSSVYATVSYLRGDMLWKEAILAFLYGHYHLWFIYAIVGLYLAVPIFRKIAEDPKTAQYFLLIALLFRSVLPITARCIGLLSRTAEHILIKMLNQFQFAPLADYAFYFLIGYFLHTMKLSKTCRKKIYLFGSLGGVGAALLTSISSLWKQEPTDIFQNYNAPTIICMSIAIFIFAKHHFQYKNLPKQIVSITQRLSQYSFGAYLVHVLILETLQRTLDLDTLFLHPMLSVPVTVLLVFILSFCISAVIHKIPVLNRYIA